MPKTVRAPLDVVAVKLRKHVDFVVEEYCKAVAIEFARAALAEAVEISPFDQGMYRASHRISVNVPRGANLSPAPSYAIPGDYEADRGMVGFEMGDAVWMGNDAGRHWKRMNRRYVYAVNVESKGWGSTPPHRVYEKVMRKLLRSSSRREISRRAMARLRAKTRMV